MKTTRDKLTILLITAITVTLLLPTLSIGASVPWSTEQYTATANGVIQNGPSLPLSATYLDCVVTDPSSGQEACAYSMSEITLTNMFVTAGRDWGGNATASFLGTFRADMPYFNFYYNLVDDQHNDSIFSMEIFDVTTSSTLSFSTLGSNAGSGNFLIDTPVDHDIRVNFSLNTNNNWYPEWPNETGASLNYSMSTNLVPEPISSILFITGGTLLAGRRFTKRKKTA